MRAHFGNFTADDYHYASQPSGAKAGLVQLSGDVKTLRLNWGIEKRRLARWDIEP